MFISTKETRAAEIIDIKVSSSLLIVVLKNGVIYFDGNTKTLYICYNAHYKNIPSFFDLSKMIANNGLVNLEHKTFVITNDQFVNIINDKFDSFVRTAIEYTKQVGMVIPRNLFLSLVEFGSGVFFNDKEFSFQEILKSDVIEVFNFKS